MRVVRKVEILIALYLVGLLAFSGGAVYVVYHFVVKYW